MEPISGHIVIAALGLNFLHDIKTTDPLAGSTIIDCNMLPTETEMFASEDSNHYVALREFRGRGL